LGQTTRFDDKNMQGRYRSEAVQETVKYLEYRGTEQSRNILAKIKKAVSRPWTLMEVCGDQTHSILQYGIEEVLPPEITIVHGPGSPVALTPISFIDKAITMAQLPDVTLCSSSEMLRVPGSKQDLLDIKAMGGDVRVVYSPLEALAMARNNPERRFVVFTVGYETTAPATALAAWQARRLGAKNFFLLTSHVSIPPVLSSVLQSTEGSVNALLGPGQVCAVTGFREYEALSRHFRLPIVITGFEPTDLLEGVLRCVQQLEAGRYEVENQYSRAVSRGGNSEAKALLEEVFRVSDKTWRGLGPIPKSGLTLSPEFAHLDADRQFNIDGTEVQEPAFCISRDVLRGLRKPLECPAFGKTCTPEHPLGATMMTADGTCAAYYKFARSG
jgi:hydrogenase expression/formation protein HypD